MLDKIIDIVSRASGYNKTLAAVTVCAEIIAKIENEHRDVIYKESYCRTGIEVKKKN